MTICWICEHPILSDVFSPFIVTTSGNANTCLKHATYYYKFTEVDSNSGALSVIIVKNDS